MSKNLIKFLIAGLLPILVLSCKKNNIAVDNDPIIPPGLARFSLTTGTFVVSPTSNVYKIPVGITNVTNAPRTINLTYTSSTGAVNGTQYNAPTSIVIPAGQALDSLAITGVASQYSGSRKDSLFVTITESTDVKPAPFANKYSLLIKGPCSETNVNLSSLLGDWNNTNELFGTSAWGPYTVTVETVNQVTPTSGTISVSNIWDTGWNPITFTLDWTNPNNRTVTLVQQSGIGDAGDISPTYAGEDVSVRPVSGQIGTFSVCDGVIVVKMQLGVTGLGFFSQLYTVTMRR